MSNDQPTCPLCGKPLLDGTSWTDHDEYGDVHVKCADLKEQGYDPSEEEAP